MLSKQTITNIKIPINTSKLVNFIEIKDKIRPFDIIAFRGGDIISDIIYMLESYEIGISDDFTHVALVVTSELLPSFIYNNKEITLEHNKLYILESTLTYNLSNYTDYPPEISTNCGYFGVQIRELETIIPRYIIKEETKVAWCPLINNPFDRLTNETDYQYNTRLSTIKDKFKQEFDKYYHTSYQANLINLFAAMFPCIRPLRTISNIVFKTIFDKLKELNITNCVGPSGWQFCSELIANIYIDFNILSKEYNPQDVLPVDFFGYDVDGIPPIVSEVLFIKDWDIPGQPAFHYIEEK
jgi:hypothetical protein